MGMPLHVLVPSEVEGLAQRAREHVLERRHAWAQMPDLHAVARGELKEQLRRPIFRHEHAHDLTGVAVTLDAFGAKRLGKARLVTLDAQLEYAARRPLQRTDRPLRGHGASME